MNKNFIYRLKEYLITISKSEAIYLNDFSVDQDQNYHFVLPSDNHALFIKLTQRCLKKHFNLALEKQSFLSETDVIARKNISINSYSCYVFTYKNYINFESLSLLKCLNFFLMSYCFPKNAFFKTYVSFLKSSKADLKQTLFQRHQSMMATVHGPYLQDPYYVREKLEQSYTQSQTLEKKLPAQEIQTILKDMIGSFNHTLGCIASMTISMFKRKIFKHVRVSFTEKTTLRKHLCESSVVYVPNHKSHIDYLLLSYCLYTQGLFPPHIAAGINLSFFPVGPILKRLGAFFIKRSIGSNKHYAFLLSHYIHYIVEEKIPQAVFFEGGRSRSGKLLDPKLGIITYQLQALHKTSDIVFVPVTINYDYTPELEHITRQLSGEKKKKENIFNFILSLPKIFKQCGDVRLHFHEGISAKTFFKDQEIKKTRITALAQNILYRIADKTSHTHGFLFALTLLQYHQKGFSEHTSFSKSNLEKVYLDSINIFYPLAAASHKKHFKRMLSLFLSHHILLKKKGHLSINLKQLPKLFYLRNTSIHTIISAWLRNNPSCPDDFQKLLSACHPALNIDKPIELALQPQQILLIHQYLQLEFKYIQTLCKKALGPLSKTESKQWIHPTLKKLLDHDLKRNKLDLTQAQWQNIDAFMLTLLNN